MVLEPFLNQRPIRITKKNYKEPMGIQVLTVPKSRPRLDQMLNGGEDRELQVIQSKEDPNFESVWLIKECREVKSNPRFVWMKL